MQQIYRFRKCRHTSIENLSYGHIEGSTYCEMPDPKEVPLTVNAKTIRLETGLSKRMICKIVQNLRAHIKKTYFIACFTKEDQTRDIKMWKQYANLRGFCLIYSDARLSNAVHATVHLSKDKYPFYKDVERGKEKVDITNPVLKYLKLVGSDLNNEKKLQFATEHYYDALNPKERQQLLRPMFRKIGRFPEKNEKRIVVNGTKGEGKYCSDMLTSPVFPHTIIVSSLMPEQQKRELKAIAKARNIKFVTMIIAKSRFGRWAVLGPKE